MVNDEVRHDGKRHRRLFFVIGHCRRFGRYRPSVASRNSVGVAACCQNSFFLHHYYKIMRPFQHRRKESSSLALGALALIVLRQRHAKQKKKRSLWAHNWLIRRDELGAYNTLMKELEEEDIPGYISFQRMHPDLFKELLEMVTPLIQKKDTRMRRSIQPGLRLALTLRYLATGSDFKSTSFMFRVAANTISQIVPAVCAAIHQVLKDKYMRCPQTHEEWSRVAAEFEEKWQFPNCVGALDGKHITVRPPANSGSYFFNYKGSFSVVLLALVDADYKFLYVDVGTNGRVSDGGVFASSKLAEKLENGTLHLPSEKCAPGSQVQFPAMIVGDDAFPLRSYLMKPFCLRKMTKGQRVFNYRLSRARRVVENAFGHLANRFRVFMTPILLQPEKVELIVLACCALHNFLRTRRPGSVAQRLDREDPESHLICPGEWRQGAQLPSVPKLIGNHSRDGAKKQREDLMNYFTAEGKVSWQDEMV